MEQPNRFQKLVAEAKKNITEISPQEVAAQQGELKIVDVRDADEFRKGSIKGARNMSRGTIELDAEEQFPDLHTPIVCYCGGGGRSALATESLQRMGYTNVRSLAGGFTAWKAAGFPTSTTH